MLKRFPLILFSSFLFFGQCFALPSPSSITVASGFMEEDNLKNRGDSYQITPLFIALGYEIRPQAEQLEAGILEFQIEFFANPVIAPDNNVEFGVSFMFMMGFPVTERFIPYFKIGTGPGYTTQHTKEQATQWNFFSTGALGLRWVLDDKKSINLEFRVRHFSNAGIQKPNDGIDTEGYVLGFTYKY